MAPSAFGAPPGAQCSFCGVTEKNGDILIAQKGGAERERERLRQQPQSPPVPGISGSSAKDLALGANKDRARAMSEEDCRAQAQV